MPPWTPPAEAALSHGAEMISGTRSDCSQLVIFVHVLCSPRFWP